MLRYFMLTQKNMYYNVAVTAKAVMCIDESFTQSKEKTVSTYVFITQLYCKYSVIFLHEDS